MTDTRTAIEELREAAEMLHDAGHQREVRQLLHTTAFWNEAEERYHAALTKLDAATQQDDERIALLEAVCEADDPEPDCSTRISFDVPVGETRAKMVKSQTWIAWRNRKDKRDALAKYEAATQENGERVALLEAKCAQWWLLVDDAILSEPGWFAFVLSTYANTSDPLTDQARALGEAATAARAEHTVCPTCGDDSGIVYGVEGEGETVMSCPKCHGSCEIDADDSFDKSAPMGGKTPCDKCHGTGSVK